MAEAAERDLLGEPEAVAGAVVSPMFGRDFEVAPLTVRDLWLDTSGMRALELSRNYSISVEAGSSRRYDTRKRLQAAESIMNLVANVELQRDNTSGYNAALAKLWKAIELPREWTQYLDEDHAKRMAEASAQAAQQTLQAEQQSREHAASLDMEKTVLKSRVDLEKRLAEIRQQQAGDPPGAGGWQ